MVIITRSKQSYEILNPRLKVNKLFLVDTVPRDTANCTMNDRVSVAWSDGVHKKYRPLRWFVTTHTIEVMFDTQSEKL